MLPIAVNFLHGDHGVSRAFSIDPGDSIKRVKQMIQKCTGFNWEFQTLIFAGDILEDETLVFETAIRQVSTLFGVYKCKWDSLQKELHESKRKLELSEAMAAEENTKRLRAEKQYSWHLASKLNWPSHYSEFHVRALSEECPVFAFFAYLVKKSCCSHRRELGLPDFCPPPELQVRQVDVVSNPRLTKQYLTFLEHLEGLRHETGCGQVAALADMKLPASCICTTTDLNEHFLFHGATLEVVNEICRAGFDPRRGGEGVGHMFGIATYLALNASKADIYTEDLTAKLPRGAERKLIVVRAALGEAHRTVEKTPKAHRPPDDVNGRALDSVWADSRQNGGCVDHVEVMSYDRGQAIPVAIVTYAHSDACSCAECLKRPLQ